MSAKKSKRNSRRRNHERGNVQDPVLRGAAMNGTSTETSTHSMDGAPPTAEEAASAYEQASDGGGPTAEGRPPKDTTPGASSGPTTTPEVTASEAGSPVPEVLSETAVPNTTTPLPDPTVSSEETPPSGTAWGAIPPSPVVPPPGTLPVPRMNLQDNLRLRMKVWTDPSTLKRYLMPMAFMRDRVHGQPISDVMYAYAMSDDSTRIVTLTAAEWNTLPFFYFQEDGHAPRTAARPMDTLP